MHILRCPCGSCNLRLSRLYGPWQIRHTPKHGFSVPRRMWLWFFERHLWQNSNHGPFCSLLRRTAQNCRCVSQRWRTYFTFLLCYAGDVLGKPRDRILELCEFLSDLVSNSSASPRDGARENGIERAWQETGIVHSNECTALSKSSGMFLLKGRAYGVDFKKDRSCLNECRESSTICSQHFVGQWKSRYFLFFPCLAHLCSVVGFCRAILKRAMRVLNQRIYGMHVPAGTQNRQKKVITFC